MQNSSGGTVPPPPPPGAIPPGGYWPPPQKKGMPAWAIVVIVVVVVLVVLAVLAAVLYVMVTGLIGTPDGTRPVIAFGPASPLVNGFEFDVAGASQTVTAANYRVALSVNATSVDVPQTLVATMTMGGYTVTWTDLGGDGDLNSGDHFRVTRSPFPANTAYVVDLLWFDGATIASRDFQS